MASRISARVGDVVETGFVCRNKQGTLTSPTAVTVEIRDQDDNVETITQTDDRVTIGATLSTGLATRLGLSTAENTAGTGIVSVEVTPDAAGFWSVYCGGTSGLIASGLVRFVVYSNHG